MSAELVVLGAGSILPRAGYGCSGYALVPGDGAPVTLFDCGPGSVRALGAVGLGVADVRRVVLSHFHVDHCLDLFALAFARRNPALSGAPPLELVGPRGLRALVEGVRGGPPGFERWIAQQDARVVEVEPAGGGSGAALELDGLRLSWFPTGHTPDALAWRAELPGGETLAYSGDSGEVAALVDAARGADLFACECSFPEELAAEHHLTPAGAARSAARAGCRTLVLTHFYPELDPERAGREAAELFGGRIELARDGSRHALQAP